MCALQAYGGSTNDIGPTFPQSQYSVATIPEAELEYPSYLLLNGSGKNSFPYIVVILSSTFSAQPQVSSPLLETIHILSIPRSQNVFKLRPVPDWVDAVCVKNT